MSALIVIEGGGKGEPDIRLREGFHKLLTSCGFAGRLPRLAAGRGASDTFRDFQLALKEKKADYVAMMVDSDEPVADHTKPWEHLSRRMNNRMKRPAGVEDDQALLMVTCMETWLVADREGLKRYYERSGQCLQQSALPPSQGLESRAPSDVIDALQRATAKCPSPYEKGRRSFEVLELVNAAALGDLLGFNRVREVLDRRLR